MRARHHLTVCPRAAQSEGRVRKSGQDAWLTLEQLKPRTSSAGATVRGR